MWATATGPTRTGTPAVGAIPWAACGAFTAGTPRRGSTAPRTTCWGGTTPEAPPPCTTDLVGHPVYRRQFADRAWAALSHGTLSGGSGPLAVDRPHGHPRPRHAGRVGPAGGTTGAPSPSPAWTGWPTTAPCWAARAIPAIPSTTTSGAAAGSSSSRCGPGAGSPIWIRRCSPSGGGWVETGYRLAMSGGPGETLYFTVDGVDPRPESLPGAEEFDLVAQDASKRVSHAQRTGRRMVPRGLRRFRLARRGGRGRLRAGLGLPESPRSGLRLPGPRRGRHPGQPPPADPVPSGGGAGLPTSCRC